MSHKRFETRMPVSQQQLYDYHASGGAFERLIPPWDQIRIQRWKGGEATSGLSVEEQFGDISAGTEVHLKVGPSPFAVSLVAKHTEHNNPNGFVDEQIRGPFSKWKHQHRFVANGDGESVLIDELDFQAPFFGWFDWLVSPKIENTFQLRHLRTLMDLTRFERYAHCGVKKIVMTGSSGLIGRNLSAFLRAGGHQVYHLVRRVPTGRNEIQWNVREQTIDTQALEGMDAVIHLAGESIDGRWTKDKKKQIYESRAEGTRLLSDALASLSNPPTVLISASAVGYYGNHATDVATEETTPTDDFLPKVCMAWESAADSAREAGIRVVHPRMGVVLSGQGGALKKMLPAFLSGAGGRLGHGKQWMPWVALEDVLGIMLPLLFDTRISGPVNVVSPEPVQNDAFTTILGKVIRRPTLIPVPAFAIRTLFGEMGQTLLLEGRKVKPEVALSIDHPYRFASLEDALRFELGYGLSITGEEQ